MLEKVKAALRLAVTVYDDELQGMIDAALADLRLVGISAEKVDKDTSDSLVIRAVVTYCRFHFGSPSDYDRLKASYDEQKAQMMMATGYKEANSNG